jgi:quercetin dioxygenase-like cupin family protein
VTDHVYAGNASDDADQYRGWLVGHFVKPDGSVRQSADVEVKWGFHPAGQRRPEWTTGETRTTLLMLLDGKFHVELGTGHHTLQKLGDYVVWGPGIDHTWVAEKDSIMLTVRWPSTDG